MSTAIIVLLCALSAGLGVSVGIGTQRIGGSDAKTVEAVGTAVGAVGTAVEAAVRPEATDAEARLTVASMPAVNIAVEAAIQPDAAARTIALAAYALCLTAAQGKTEGSSAFGCQDRGKVLDALLVM